MSRTIVKLTIEVPDNIDVQPVIVRKGGTITGAALPAKMSLPVLRDLKFDLTTSKTAEWLAKPNVQGSNCCCVRG